ncbi:MAG TPA: hypothetical protein VNL94_09130 [Candidatus Binatia bacterium]|nr:hypothetical protein [Candidatus Binatia bacterium]
MVKREHRTRGGVSEQWLPVRIALEERGLNRPPTEAQRQAMWEAVDSCPNDRARWIRSAPGGAKMTDIVGIVLDRWHGFRASA